MAENRIEKGRSSLSAWIQAPEQEAGRHQRKGAVSGPRASSVVRSVADATVVELEFSIVEYIVQPEGRGGNGRVLHGGSFVEAEPDRRSGRESGERGGDVVDPEQERRKLGHHLHPPDPEFFGQWSWSVRDGGLRHVGRR